MKTKSVKLDTSVYNAARICKFYGSLACKGDNLSDRKHRLSQILDLPACLETVSKVQLESLAGTQRKATNNPAPSNSSATCNFDVEEWLQRFKIDVNRRKPYADGGWLWDLAKCPWKPDATDGSPYVIKFANGHIMAGCHHNSCQGRTWRDLRDHYEPGWRNASNTGIGENDKPLEAASDPHRLARLYLDTHGSEPGLGLTIRWWAGAWFRWNGSFYVPLPPDDLRAELVACVKSEFDRIAKAKRVNGGIEAVQPVTRNVIANVLLALESLARIRANYQPPAWLAGNDLKWSADEMIATKCELIHLPSYLDKVEYCLPSTPNFFNLSALGYEVLREPGTAERWFQFLNELWPNDSQSVDTLRMWFGLCLTPDTRQQKILMLVGPPRSGKGTIIRVLTKLLGESNVVSPTAATFSRQFGLKELIGKLLAIVPDARFGSRSDSSMIVERLLSISGEDSLSVDRKYLDSITVRLKTRLMIVSNELPRLPDAAGALASRHAHQQREYDRD